MANNKEISDIKLVVGVDRNASYAEMKKGIEAVTAKLNAKPPKIKVELAVDNAQEYSGVIKEMNAAMQSLKKTTEEYGKALAGINTKSSGGIGASGFLKELDILTDAVKKVETIEKVLWRIKGNSPLKDIGRAERFAPAHLNMPIVITVLCGYTQFRYYGCCNTAV